VHRTRDESTGQQWFARSRIVLNRKKILRIEQVEAAHPLVVTRASEHPDVPVAYDRRGVPLADVDTPRIGRSSCVDG